MSYKTFLIKWRKRYIFSSTFLLGISTSEGTNWLVEISVFSSNLPTDRGINRFVERFTSLLNLLTSEDLNWILETSTFLLGLSTDKDID